MSIGEYHDSSCILLSTHTIEVLPFHGWASVVLQAVYTYFVCVCVRERERERERGGGTDRE